MNALLKIISGNLAQRLVEMPAPHPSCRTYDFAGSVVMHRNHARQVEMSANLYAPDRDSGLSPTEPEGGTYHDPSDYDADNTDAHGNKLSYADMTGGY